VDRASDFEAHGYAAPGKGEHESVAPNDSLLLELYGELPTGAFAIQK
jgi:hypothetical protein